MNASTGETLNFVSTRLNPRAGIFLLLCLHVAVCCLSLIYVADVYGYLKIAMFNNSRLYAAALFVVPFAIVSYAFALSRFSFGYFLGFYFYTMINGYLWLAAFSKFDYDRTSASVSAFVSALAFLAPALFITSPIKQRLVLSARALDSLLWLIIILSALVIAFGAFYNFRLIGLDDIYSFRGGLEFPAGLRYAIGVTSNALLPFAFACFVLRKNWWRAAAILLLLLMFYPITLSKVALFAPFWLLFLVLLSGFFDARISVVLSLFLPVAIGVILTLLYKSGALSFGSIIYYFGSINFRMVAFPSIALDVYNDFFSTHDRTYFCQILLLKPFVDCPYNSPLSIMMEKAYQLGNMNASLFATEGVASVGLIMAPVTVLACGLVIAVANRISSGLPSRFVLLSGGVLPQIFINVPFTTTLLTGGAAALFLLWYITPRAVFEQNDQNSRAH